MLSRLVAFAEPRGIGPCSAHRGQHDRSVIRLMDPPTVASEGIAARPTGHLTMRSPVVSVAVHSLSQ
jgi:hypothetical protein